MIALRRSHSTSSVLTSLSGLVATLERWTERRRQRRALLGLDDKLLKDIGLSPADAWREGTKPFWHG